MKRTIKFRGKRVDNGEWVYGNLLLFGSTYEIIPQIGIGLVESRKVDPTTVGQFTGLTDKNGKEIYEGDMVLHNAIVPQPEKLTIIFKDGAFCLYAPFSVKGDTSVTIRDAMFQAIKVDMELEIEVISNIHDNPELLKEEQK